AILLPALGAVPAPTPLAEECMRTASASPQEEIASTAQLALGNMARNLSQTDPGRAARLVGGFIRSLRAAPSPERVQHWLLVLGNAAAAEALPEIARFLNDPEAETRAAAAFALRFLEARGVDAFLSRALTADGEATVRLEAAAALEFRAPTAATLAA